MEGGAGGTEELPRGTLTFLFTDIEGSTRRWEVHGDAMAACVERHETILRSAIESHRGRVVKSTGDGLMAVFPVADDAIDAAVSGQLAIGAEDWAPMPRLRVRMGLHTGSVEPTGQDYFGVVVNRAARVADAGHGGQVLVSATTAAVVERRDRAQLVSRGRVRLKDLSAPVELFQVLAPGLDDEQLTLRTLDQELADLPIQRTSFVGRDAEVEHAVRLLEHHRLVTLAGPGGVGKTRLAVHVAGEVAQQFDAGVRFVDLSETGPTGHVAATVLDELQRRNPAVARATAAEDPMEGLVRLLSGSEVLIVVDNCEQVVHDASMVIDGLLAHCPRVRVVATSREPLHIPGEQVVPVSSLPTRAEHDSPAVQLFIERAVAAGATPPAAGSLATIAQICELVDGLPLGIELAAARSTHLSVDNLAERLAGRHQLLHDRDPTRPDRHRNVEELLRWSVDLLAPAERLLLIRLATFAGPVPLEAVERLCGDQFLPTPDVLDHLSTLVDRSLAMYDDVDDRYRLLNIVRAFARSQIDGDETRCWRLRHAEWCAAALREARVDETDDALVRFMQAHGPEIATALAWAIEERNTELAWTLAGLAWRWYEVTGRVHEGLDLVQRALATGPAAASPAWASVATGAASLAMLLGDVRFAIEMHARARDAFLTDGSERDAAWTRIGLAMAMMLANEPDAETEARRALVVFERSGDQRGITHARSALGLVSARASDHAGAKLHYLEALATSRLGGHRRDTASVLSNLGNLSQDRGELLEASRFYDGALQLYREIGDHRGAGLILNNLCIVNRARGNQDRAVQLSLEAIAEFNRVQDRQGAAAARHNLANLAIEADDDDAAFAHFEQAIEAFREARDPRGVVMVLSAGADAARRCGRSALAWRYDVSRARVLHRLGVTGPALRLLGELAVRARDLALLELAERLDRAAATMLPGDVERALEDAGLAVVDEWDSDRQSGRPGHPPERPHDELGELTDRETELLAEVGRGKTNSEIADSLFISRRTVDAHLSHIRAKLGVTDRSKLIVLARDALALSSSE